MNLISNTHSETVVKESAQLAFEALLSYGFDFFTGVPDSTYQGLITHIHESSLCQNITTVNEGEAIAVAAGYHLASGKIPVVYIQNSGFGNCINPLTSLCDEFVYQIPMLLLIGWRGAPDMKDEPQHLRMGGAMLDFLKLLKIDYTIVDDFDFKSKICLARENICKNKSIHALVIKPGIIKASTKYHLVDTVFELTRIQVIELAVKYLDDYIFVGTTGKTSRELYETRRNNGQEPSDLYIVGSMGYAGAVAHTVARFTEKKIALINGDGAFLMHMGTYVTHANTSKNIIHILIDNNAHDSTGGQKTLSDKINIHDFFELFNSKVYFATDKKSFIEALITAKQDGYGVIVVKTKLGASAKLGRPNEDFKSIKNNFVNKLCETTNISLKQAM